MDRGRPKITLKDLPKDWKEKTLEIGRNGGMDIHMRVDAMGHICHETWVRLLKDEKDFSETVTRARELAECWWKYKPASHLENKDFNTNLFGKVMANKYGWRDKQDVTSDAKPISMVITLGENKL